MNSSAHVNGCLGEAEAILDYEYCGGRSILFQK
jgi:hypothetical protein